MKLFILMVIMIPMAGPGQEQANIDPVDVRQVEKSLDQCLADAKKVLLIEPNDVGMTTITATCGPIPPDKQQSG